ncbi:magnesium transporter CorA family protein [Phenylobacterium aquaticum]|uniref:magnesium transporter CorA family protein n=1 Tax=Phenylobacterium aquaticum TaxID=1763816 RepID=UPI0026F301FE|nr:magnesium transporter CorA family protein [Phenylobacterium aquaticum]
MLHLLRQGASRLETIAVAPDWAPPADALWIDLESPSREEELAVEQALGLDLPTREEMAQIEPSSRLYQEGGATFLTASLLARSDGEHPAATPVTFVLTGELLVTIRYDHLKAFEAFAQSALQNGKPTCGGEALMGLLEAVVERLASVLERGSARVQASSNAIFDRPRGAAFEPLLTGLSRTQSITAMAQISLISLGRLASFAMLADEIGGAPARKAHLHSIQHDVQSLTEHSGHLGTHISFLLDAALGLINIEQNNIMKVFSLATVILMPPTLVGAIYGMNFVHMPELSWKLGYPMALGLMVVSGLGPALWFKRRGWF